MTGGNVTKEQWYAIESIVRKEQVQALQHMNTHYYNELSDILDELHNYTNSDK